MSKEAKKYYNIVKNEADREATIYIYGAIGGIDWDTWEEINTASKFSEEFKELEKEADTIHVRINSPGGFVFEGLAIYNTLIASSKTIITYNDGICASMAALILLAGDEIQAFKNSLLMIHNSSSFYGGNKQEVEEQLKAADKIDKALGTAIEERLGISAEEVEKDYLNYKDNWYTSDEALEIGFYDNIIQKEKAQVPEDVMDLNPVQMFNRYAAMTFNIPENKQKSKSTNTMSKNTSRPNLQAALGLEHPLASTDEGSFLNELQLNTLENKLSANATALQNAKDAQKEAENNLATEKVERKKEVDAEKANTTAAITDLREAAKLAGVEDLTDDASAEDINKALTAKINELNGKPGAAHTNGASEDEPEGKHDYLDFDNSIYNQIK